MLTGVPPLSADGFQIPFDNDADRMAAQRKMVGGSLNSLKEMAGAAAYAVWYFSTVRDPFGTKGKAHKSNRERSRAFKAKARKRGHRPAFRWHGHNTRVRR